LSTRSGSVAIGAQVFVTGNDLTRIPIAALASSSARLSTSDDAGAI
jgi:hypothetical protein